MQKRKTDEKGFTLIEVIVTLILVGITAALAGMWIVSVANGYIFAKMNASTVQKAQLAITRLEKEFLAIRTVTSAAAGQITYTRPDSVLGVLDLPVTVSLSGDALQLQVNGGAQNILTDSVSSNGFSLQYCNYILGSGTPVCSNDWTGTWSIIEITLTLTGANGVQSPPFTRRVAPRNL